MQAIGASVIASCHGPLLRGRQVAEAFDLLRELPRLPATVWPAQADLEAMHQVLAAAA